MARRRRLVHVHLLPAHPVAGSWYAGCLGCTQGASAGILRLQAPEPLRSVTINYIVLAAAALFEATSLTVAFLAGVALLLGSERRGLLIGERALPDVVAGARGVLADNPQVAEIEDVSTMQIGPDEVLLTVRLAFRTGLRDSAVAQAIRELEREILRRFPQIKRVFLDASTWRPSGAGRGGCVRRRRPPSLASARIPRRRGREGPASYGPATTAGAPSPKGVFSSR